MSMVIGETISDRLAGYEADLRQDYEVLAELYHEGDLRDQADGLTALQKTMDTTFESIDSVYLMHTAPLLSLELVRDAYQGIFNIGKVGDLHQKFIGETILPQTGILPSEPVHEGPFDPTRRTATCSRAETTFANTLYLINDDPRYRTDHHQPRISTYHDKAGQPVILRKNLSSSSGLTLEAISLDGLIVPAGTIIGMGRSMNQHPTGNKEISPENILDTFELPDELDIMPSRISPWAYDDPIKRSYFAMGFSTEGKSSFPFDPTRYEVVEPTELEDFKAAAKRVMELCGSA